MTLYVQSGTENTIEDTYLRRFWCECFGYSGCGSPYKLGIPSGWHADPSWNECATYHCCGDHGGCTGCMMTQVQTVADYETEVTFITNPIGAQIFIDDVEWWPGAVTASDGATFRGIPPAINPTPHTYELRKAGYISAIGTFQVMLNTTTTITETLLQSFTNITVQNVTVGGTSCLTGCNVTCMVACPTIVDIVVIWENSGNVSGTFTPTITVNPLGTSANGTPITVSSMGTGTTTFSGISLPEGMANVCFDTGTIT
jgi:hypothetical protein